MSRPLVSVVIPAFNQAGLLEIAVTSALNQSVSDVEVLVVDDGSTDETREMCLAMDDPRIVLLAQDNDGTKGIGARNLGLMRAAGDWIALLDQDDVWLPRKLEAQLDALAAQPVAGAAFCRVRFIDGNGIECGDQPGSLPRGSVFHDLLKRNPYFVSSGMFRRDLIPRMGLPHESVGLGDWALWLSVARHTKVVADDDVLALYRVHAAGYQATQGFVQGREFWEDHWAFAKFAETRMHRACRDCADGVAELRRMVSLNQVRLAGEQLRRGRFDVNTRRNLSLAWAAQPRPWTVAAALVRRATGTLR